MKALIIALALTAPVDSLPDLSHPWTLARCIDWAMENNLTVLQQEDNLQGREIDKNTAEWSWLPSVNASASEDWSFGRGLGGNNTYESGNSSSTGFSLGGNMTLFDGLATPRRIDLARLNLDAAVNDLEKARDDIRVSVAQGYVQVLYNYEIRDVAREQLAIDSLQVARLESLFQSGKASAAEVSQQKASLAQSQLTLVQAENNLRTSLLDLAQLLELPEWNGFNIVRPEIEPEPVYLGTPDDIYADALGIRPAIKAEQLRLEGARKQVDIAKSAYSPSLSLSAGMGTNYYTSFNSISFWDQLNKNFSQYVRLSLSIPIFNKFSTRNQVRSAQLSLHTQQLQLRRAEQNLYKEIQQAWNGAVAAQAKWEAAKVASDAARDAFELMQAKYENGKATLTEFNESRNRLVKSQSDAAQASFEYIFQTSLVQFYRGAPMTL